MGHIAHLRQFQSIKTFTQRHDYTITLIKRKKILFSFLRNKHSFTCKIRSPIQPGMLCVKFGWNLQKWFWSWEGTFNVFQCIFAILFLFPLWKRAGPSFELSWITFTQGCFVPSLVQWFWRRRWQCEKFMTTTTTNTLTKLTSDNRQILIKKSYKKHNNKK